MQKLDELELKEKKNECAGTDASGKSTELEQTKSPSKAVPKAGQQQQERRIRYVQETLETSVLLATLPWQGKGGGGRSGWCQGSGMGRRSLAGLRYMSYRSAKTAISKGPWRGFPRGSHWQGRARGQQQRRG